MGTISDARLAAENDERLIERCLAGEEAAWEAGYAKQNATLVSGRLSIPISLVPAQRSVTVIPYIAPGVGGGLVHDDSGTEVGLLFTLGAGIGLRTTHGFTAHAGISRAFLSTGNWLAGVGITID